MKLDTSSLAHTQWECKYHNLSHIPVYVMGEEQLSRYALYMAALGNRPDLFPGSAYIGRYDGPVTRYEIPPEALEDEQFAAMIAKCYMLGKCWTGAYCRYFREAVLPLDPGLEASLTTPIPAPELRICPVCGRSFPPNRQQRYCSPTCQAEANRQKSRQRMRNKRRRRYD